MMTALTYYAMFFDSGRCLGNKRVDRNVWFNLVDGLEGKTVMLESELYQVGQVRIFDIINSVDNNRFAVVDVKINK